MFITRATKGRLDGINFDYSAITNIDKDHIDYHKTLRNYIHSKLNIINQSIKVVLNHDCINLKKLIIFNINVNKNITSQKTK